MIIKMILGFSLCISKKNNNIEKESLIMVIHSALFRLNITIVNYMIQSGSKLTQSTPLKTL